MSQYSFLDESEEHSPIVLIKPTDSPRFPKVAKNTRRLIGLLNEEDRRKVARIKTIPIREKTEDTLSVVTTIRFCSGVSGGGMLPKCNPLSGLEDRSCYQASGYFDVLAKRQLGG